MSLINFIFASIIIGVAAGQTDTLPTITFTIIEELPSGYHVGNIAEKSRQYLETTKYSSLIYTFQSPTEAQTLFSINDSTGNIFTSVVIDRETVCDFKVLCLLEFNVIVRELEGPFAQSITVQIFVEDKNDNSPLFPREMYPLTISEGVHNGSTFGLDTAVDKDRGDNNSIQSYKLLTDSDYNNTFGLNVTKNKYNMFIVKLVVQKILDRETKDSYIVKIAAVDGGTSARSGTLTITVNIEDINDNQPKFSKEIYNIAINETTPIKNTILTLSATDKDMGDNAEVSYHVNQYQNGKDEINRLFYVEETTGELKVNADLKSVAGETFRFIVEAMDHGDEPLVTQAEVIINIKDSVNDPPVVTVSLPSPGNIGFVNITESASLETYVAHVSADDTDSGDNGEILCTVSNAHFGIESLGARGAGFKVTVKSILDREVQNVHNVTVTCVDKGVPVMSGSASFLVRVTDKNDNKPMFEKPIYTAKIHENNKGNEMLTQVSATDADEGNNAMIHYEMHGDANGRFVVDRNTGVIFANSIYDREPEDTDVIQDTITFHVLAVDNGKPNLNGTATIVVIIEDENDVAPKFNNSVYGFKIMENQPTGTDIAKLEALDLDEGENGEFDFAIAPEYIDKVPFILFSDGLLKANKQLDREERSRYDFVAIVTDHGETPLSSAAHVTVIVDDMNDNSPIVTYPKPSNNTVTVWYPEFEEDHVTTITAYDIDDDSNNELEYVIRSGNDLGIFGLDAATGNLYFDSVIDIGANKKILLKIAIVDKGEPALETIVDLHVNLMYTNATTLGTEDDSDTSKYIIISVVVVLATLLISGGIIGVILFLRTLDRKRKQKDVEDNNNSPDMDFGFTHTQSHTSVITADGMFSSSGEGRDLGKKKEVSFLIDTSDPQEYYEQKHDTSLSIATQDKPSKSSLRNPSPSTPSAPILATLNSRDLQEKADTQLQSMKIQQVHLQSRAQQWVQQQQQQQQQQQFGSLPHDDHHSETSAETIGSDSGRGASEEDDIHSSPSADDPKHFDLSSPEAQRSYLSPHNDLYIDNNNYMDVHNAQQSSYSKQPWTRKPHLATKDLKTSCHSYKATYPDVISNSYNSRSENNVTWGDTYYTVASPMDYTGDSALHSFFDKTSVNLHRDDDDNCSTTTSGSYTLYSEEIL